MIAGFNSEIENIKFDHKTDLTNLSSKCNSDLEKIQSRNKEERDRLQIENNHMMESSHERIAKLFASQIKDTQAEIDQHKNNAVSQSSEIEILKKELEKERKSSHDAQIEQEKLINEANNQKLIIFSKNQTLQHSIEKSAKEIIDLQKKVERMKYSSKTSKKDRKDKYDKRKKDDESKDGLKKDRTRRESNRPDSRKKSRH